jgi:hypothetical protein
VGNLVRDIAFGADGAAWLAVAGAGVSRVQGEDWRGYREAEGLPATPDLTAIAVDGAATVWVGTRDEGLYRLAAGDERWEQLLPDTEAPEKGPGAATVADLAVSPDGGTLWVAHGRTHEGDPPALSRLDVASGAWSQLFAQAPGAEDEAAESPPAGQVMALAFDEAGTLWLGTWARGVMAFDGSNWRSFGERDGLCGRNVWSVAAGSGAVWVACGRDRAGAADYGAGVARWDGRAWTTLDEAGGLPTDDVVALAVAGGRAYLGTNTGSGPGFGVVVAEEAVSAPAIRPLRTAGQTPASNDITAIAFTPDDAQWVGTRGAGLLRLSGEGWERMTQADTPGLAGDTVTSLATDGSKLYVGTTKTRYDGSAYTDGGLSVLDLGSGAWEKHTEADGGLPDDEVSSLALAPDGRLWVGIGVAQDATGSGTNAQHGDGVAVFDPVTGSWSTATRASTSGGLAGDTVTGLAIAGADLWLATSYGWDSAGNKAGGGVSRLAGSEWRAWAGCQEGLMTFTDLPAGVTGDLRSVLVDRGGTPWAGTWNLADPNELPGTWPRVNAVVNRWDGAAWQAETFDGAGWVSALGQDTVGQGRLWAGTSRGPITEFNPAGAVWLEDGPGGVYLREDDSWENLTSASSGLTANSITALAVDPVTGHMWAGTTSGGLSVYESGQPIAVSAATPCADCPAPLGGLDVASAPASEPPDDEGLPLGVILGAGVALLIFAWALLQRRSRRSSA